MKFKNEVSQHSAECLVFNIPNWNLFGFWDLSFGIS
jgi:hypothetical protein